MEQEKRGKGELRNGRYPRNQAAILSRSSAAESFFTKPGEGQQEDGQQRLVPVRTRIKKGEDDEQAERRGEPGDQSAGIVAHVPEDPDQ
ncbi:hypothetical protein [Sphingomonas vulcanisoli]|uniref:hypothetical protein n=1 Tax=Sphingomonas vulcanisoli TaxID=1658060 RepID=UPI00141F1BC8|nr:hypothetical protein [Sphingomonas vulcanisoli]